MFRTKAQLIEFLDRYWEEDDKFYVPLIFTQRELNDMSVDERNEAESPEPLSEAELDLWADRVDNAADWESIEQTSSEQYRTILEERGIN